MKDIKEIAKEYTREEFLNEAAKCGSLFLCPRYSGLNQKCLSTVYDEKKCRECWREAVKDITFKGEELTAICINDKTERDKKIKVLGITEGKEYQVKPSRYVNLYELVNDLGQVETYFMDRFKVLETTLLFEDFNIECYSNGDAEIKLDNEGEKMEDKIIKVRCIDTGLYEDITKDKEYKVIEEERSMYYIHNDYEVGKTYPKTLFEKVEDVLMVECVNNSGMDTTLRLNKIYHVIKETKGRYVLEEVGEAYEFCKDRFKPVEPQKEIKEYSVMELLDFPVGAKFKDKEGYVLEVVQAIGGLSDKELRCNWILNRNNGEDRLVLSTGWLRTKFIKIEEPKPVSTAEAFKALDEGKIIESNKGYRYKKIDGKIKELGEVFKYNYIGMEELEGQWIIHE